MAKILEETLELVVGLYGAYDQKGSGWFFCLGTLRNRPAIYVCFWYEA